MGPTGGRRLRDGGPAASRVLGPNGPQPENRRCPVPGPGGPSSRRGALESRAKATASKEVLVARGVLKARPATTSREARARVAAPPSAPGTRGALPPGPSPGPKAPGTRPAPLAREGHTHPLWLSSFGPESLRVSLRRSHLFSWTGATSEWGTWGQRATFAGRWPWRRSEQLRAGRDAELALG